MEKTIRESLEGRVKELQSSVRYHETEVSAAKLQIEAINNILCVKVKSCN